MAAEFRELLYRQTACGPSPSRARIAFDRKMVASDIELIGSANHSTVVAATWIEMDGDAVAP